MANVGGNLDGGRELSMVEQKNPFLGSLLRKIINSVNMVAKNASVSATGEVAAPKAPDSVNVSTAGEMMHVSISHGGQLQRNVQYFTEIDTSPTFPQPMVYHHGASRTPPPISLPTKNGSGTNINYYVRSYAQYPSSQPSEPTVAGGASSPTAFTMGGATAMTLLPSTGSGTAANTGQQGASGLGKVQQRG